MKRGLFRDPHSALRFAYRQHAAGPTVAGTLGRLGSVSARGGMTGAEWAAQAAAILRWVASLAPAERAYLGSFYGAGPAREAALAELLRLPAVREACPDGAADVLRRYTTEERDREPLRALARRLGVAHTTVLRAERRMAAALSAHFSACEARVWAEFARLGWTDHPDADAQ